MLEFMQTFDGSQPVLRAEQREDAARRLGAVADHLLKRWRSRVVMVPVVGSTQWERLLLDDQFGEHHLLWEVSRLITPDGHVTSCVDVCHIQLSSRRLHMYDASTEKAEARRYSMPSGLRAGWLGLWNVFADRLLERELVLGLDSQLMRHEGSVGEDEIVALHEAAMFAEPMAAQHVRAIQICGR